MFTFHGVIFLFNFFKHTLHPIGGIVSFDSQKNDKIYTKVFWDRLNMFVITVLIYV